MDRMEAMSEAIKAMEPALRVRGLCPDYGRFNQQFNFGYYSEPELIPQAIENSAADKNLLTTLPESGIL